ncbi:putative dehydrogenase [Nonomuraea jabiensis]|uniref:Putative dehydrogenase n=1 Tax=Nonomuraea jabiensis TaxID=882448 RepID=A0A7W9GE75_9ACTN|nr:putative dehydrogenase [Nonomuraea jabiensis]
MLIEKPITVTAAEARTLAEAARAADVLVMEAMWSRYLPQTSVIRKLLADGVLDVRAVLADHGQAITADPQHRLYRPEQGGGRCWIWASTRCSSPPWSSALPRGSSRSAR